MQPHLQRRVRIELNVLKSCRASFLRKGVRHDYFLQYKGVKLRVLLSTDGILFGEVICFVDFLYFPLLYIYIRGENLFNDRCVRFV